MAATREKREPYTNEMFAYLHQHPTAKKTTMMNAVFDWTSLGIFIRYRAAKNGTLAKCPK
jgi:hypothetical protein